MYSALDHDFMRMALQEAKKSLFISNPNPRVGCIITQQNQVIARGHTQSVGNAHAEIVAMDEAIRLGHDLQGATVYVTLEPCAHHGRTPPCIDRLICAKVGMVMVAMLDPNPLVAGRGIEALKQAGITVRCGLLEHDAQLLNPGFIRRMRHHKPWVRMKLAASLDGTTALKNGQSQWITSIDARHDGHLWRAQACCILSGIGTVQSDNPRLNVRGIDTPRQPLRVIVDSYLDIQPDAHVLNTSSGSYTLMACGKADPQRYEERQREFRENHVGLVQLPDETSGKVDLQKLMHYLAQHLHMNEVHVEAGYKLNGSLLMANCVDEILLYLAPTMLGPGLGLANLPELEILPDHEKSPWIIHEHTMIGGDLRIRLMKRQSLAELN